MNIYIGNLSFAATTSDVRRAFEAHRTVFSANLIMDRDTCRPRGFGFVEMPNDEEAGKAIATIDGTEIAGRAVKVNEARPRGDRGPRRGGGGHRGW